MEQVGTQADIQYDVHIKVDRLRNFMRREGLDAVVINRQDNFAWITAGGDNRVITTSETKFAHLVITQQEKYLVSHTIDANRFLEEQVPGQGYQLEELYWYEGDLLDRVQVIIKGLRAASDIPIPNMRMLGQEFSTLHYPLTGLDIQRMRWVGKTSHDLLARIGHQILPGMSELEIAASIVHQYTLAGMTVDVLIVGVDERVFRYRHPLPTENVLEKYALLHSAARRWGVHANVTRLVHFGPPNREVQRAVDGVLAIEGQTFAMIAPGVRFADILEAQKGWYAEAGFPEDWRYHFQGGTTGYTLADPSHSLNPKAYIQPGYGFDYFVTITGAKTENLALLTESGLEILSSGEGWPVRKIHTSSGDIQVPDMLLR